MHSCINTFVRILHQIQKIYTNPIFLNSTSVATIDNVNKAKSFRNVFCYNLIHNLRFSNARTINNDNTFL